MSKVIKLVLSKSAKSFSTVYFKLMLIFTSCAHSYFAFAKAQSLQTPGYMAQKLTLKKIAQELGVSISTVSKSLRDSYEIGEETRERVKAYAKKYHYRPNNIALSLKNQKTKKIGIIIPEIVHHFFASVISGVEHVANERGYQVIICLSDESFEKEVVNMDMLASGSIDGFILSLSKETLNKQDFNHIREVIHQGMPVVMFDRVVEDINCDKVIIDDVATAKRAVDHLLSKGCKKIGMLSTEDYINVGKLRTEGFRNALRQRGLEVHEEDILKIKNEDTMKEQIIQFLKATDYDGLMTVNEIFTVVANGVLQNTGRKVPDDVKLVGFTDGILSRYANPPLTTMSQHGEQMGRLSATKLIDRLEADTEEDEKYETVIVETELIERRSTQ